MIEPKEKYTIISAIALALIICGIMVSLIITNHNLQKKYLEAKTEALKNKYETLQAQEKKSIEEIKNAFSDLYSILDTIDPLNNDLKQYNQNIKEKLKSILAYRGVNQEDIDSFFNNIANEDL